MVHTSSLVVFTAVAFGAVSSVIAAPLGGTPANAAAPANGAAQGALQQVDATIQSQDNLITQAKDKDALADQSKAKALEAQAKALEGQAVSLDSALAPKRKEKKKEERKKLGEAGTGKPRYGTSRVARPAGQGPKRMDTTTTDNQPRDVTPPPAPVGGPQRTTTSQSAPAPVGNGVSGRPNGSPAGAVGASGNAWKAPQAKQVAQVSPGQQLIQQQDAQITAEKNKFALADEQRAKALEAQAQAWMKQADTLDPALAKPAPKSNIRVGSAATKPAPLNPASQRVYRRGAGDQSQAAADGASGAIATQDRTLTAMKDTDAKKDAAQAAKLEAEAKQLTTQAGDLDPALKKPMSHKKQRKDRKEQDRAAKQVSGQERSGTQRTRTPGAAPAQAAAAQSQVARYDFDDDYYFGRDYDEELYSRELFDGEEMYGREWYDLEELD